MKSLRYHARRKFDRVRHAKLTIMQQFNFNSTGNTTLFNFVIENHRTISYKCDSIELFEVFRDEFHMRNPQVICFGILNEWNFQRALRNHSSNIYHSVKTTFGHVEEINVSPRFVSILSVSIRERDKSIYHICLIKVIWLCPDAKWSRCVLTWTTSRSLDYFFNELAFHHFWREKKNVHMDFVYYMFWKKKKSTIMEESRAPTSTSISQLLLNL